MNLTPFAKGSVDIDAALEAAGWTLQNRDAINLSSGPGVASSVEARTAAGPPALRGTASRRSDIDLLVMGLEHQAGWPGHLLLNRG